MQPRGALTRSSTIATGPRMAYCWQMQLYVWSQLEQPETEVRTLQNRTLEKKAVAVVLTMEIRKLYRPLQLTAAHRLHLRRMRNRLEGLLGRDIGRVEVDPRTLRGCTRRTQGNVLDTLCRVSPNIRAALLPLCRIMVHR